MMNNTENELELTNKLLVEMVKNQKNNFKIIMKLYLITLVCFTIIIISMVVGFLIYESQFEQLETTTETTYEQEVSGNDSEINNVEGNLYKDNATHNDRKRLDACKTESNSKENYEN